MSMDGQGTKFRRNIVENLNRLSRAHERFRRQTDGRATEIANVNVSSRSLTNNNNNIVHDDNRRIFDVGLDERVGPPIFGVDQR